ncbi:MAG: hypothetical protein HOI95_19185 [Chromatiales bacterium]|nr:hypothetical protein [Chromatiales bacterium]
MRKVGLAIALAWVTAALLAAIGFDATYGRALTAGDAVVGYLLFPFAMPLALIQLLGFSVGPQGAMPLVAAYWAVVAWLHYLALIGRRPIVVVVLLLVIVGSGWRWQINGQGLLGL